MDKEYYTEIAKEKNIESIFKLGINYEDAGDLKSAESCYLIAVNDGDLQAQYNLALLYWNTEDYSRARDYWLDAANKGDVYSIHSLGSLAMQEENFDEAEKHWTLAAEKGNLASQKGLAYLYSLTGRFEDSEACYLELLEEETEAKERADLWKDLGDLYLKYNVLEKAKDQYIQATSHGNVEAWFNLGNLYEEQGFIDEAITCYKLGHEKGNIDCRFPLGYIYERLQKYNQAIEVWEKAALEGDLMSAQFLGWLYVRMGYTDAAVPYFLMLEDGGDKEYSLGNAYFMLKKWDLAANHLGIALQLLDKESDFYYYVLSRLSYIYFIQNQQQEKALEYVERAYQTRPDVRISTFYGLILLWNNRVEEALIVAQDFWYDEGTLVHGLDELVDFLLLLSLKEGPQTVYDYFKKEEGLALELETRPQLRTIYQMTLTVLGKGTKARETEDFVAEEEKKLRERMTFLANTYCK